MNNLSNRKALILLATLKKKEQSNTQVLSEFLSERLEKSGAACEIIKLVEKNVLPGTYSDMGPGDGWPTILEKILAANIVIFATPVWWSGHSSEMQKVIERLDEIHDEILAGKKSRLEGKVGGIIVTGDSDGAQHITGNISNFFNAVGIMLPPYTTLTVLSEIQAKGVKTSREDLLKEYEKEYGETADTMVEKLLEFA